MMPAILQRFTVAGLHGSKAKKVSARLRDNTLILVGENGSGKTTFLRMLFYFLAGRWLSLLQFRFGHIEAQVGEKTFVISRDELSKGVRKIDGRVLSGFPISVRRYIKRLIDNGEFDRVSIEIEKLGLHYGSPEFWAHQAELFEPVIDAQAIGGDLQRKAKSLRDIFDTQILYLPTYRRIERELSSIVDGFNPDDFQASVARNRVKNRETGDAFIELVEFGMKDVQAAVDRARESIKEFARQNLNSLTVKYLGDIVNKAYQTVDKQELADASEDTIHAVLGRIDETILTKGHKTQLFTAINSARSAGFPTDHDRIVCHYFLKLRSFQEALEAKEKSITEFCDLCSQYITDKRFVYDRATFQFSIVPVDGGLTSQPIELGELSSGEKQIVSLFSHLYLSGIRKFFVLIDEPELSLSVPWQRRFLVDIRNAEFCSGLVAVTHSPFIYDNSLKRFAHSLGEFISL